jgi:phage-related protein
MLFSIELRSDGAGAGRLEAHEDRGSGVMEIRIHREGEWRVVYVAKFEKAVYVLHAFEKKTQQTRQADIELAKARYKEVEAHEKAKQKRKR